LVDFCDMLRRLILLKIGRATGVELTLLSNSSRVLEFSYARFI